MTIIEILPPDRSAGEHLQGVQSSDRRARKRYDMSEPATLRSCRGCLTGRLLDLSITGARICIIRGCVPNVGDLATIELLDHRFLCGRVAWTGHTELGIAFSRSLPGVEDFVWSEVRDTSWLRGVARKLPPHGR